MLGIKHALWGLALLIFGGLIWSGVGVGLAQGDDENVCRMAFESALAASQEACQEVAAGEACWSEDGTRTPFDTVDVLASGAREWDVVQLVLDNAAGDSVRLMVAGDMVLQNLAPEIIETPTCAATNINSNNVNVRGGPSRDAAIVGTLGAGQTVVVDGRNGAGDWLHFSQEDGQGWILGELLTVDCAPLDDLNILEDDVMVQTSPLASLHLIRGAGSNCGDLPQGVLVAVGDGQRVNLLVNERLFLLEKTAFLSVDAAGILQVYALTGRVEVDGLPIPIGTWADLETETLQLGRAADEVLVLADVLLYAEPLEQALGYVEQWGSVAAQRVEPIACRVGDTMALEMPLSQASDADTVMALSLDPPQQDLLATVIQGVELFRLTCLAAGEQDLVLQVIYGDGQRENFVYQVTIAE